MDGVEEQKHTRLRGCDQKHLGGDRSLEIDPTLSSSNTVCKRGAYMPSSSIIRGSFGARIGDNSKEKKHEEGGGNLP
ncbi:hypothetical protein GOBAR_DD22915 [Gossypium barbadense]|nr:hypothetical protein GOBAR_DD22915 [Gossypium barbadense]